MGIFRSIGGGGDPGSLKERGILTLTASGKLSSEDAQGAIVVVNHASAVTAIDLPAVASAVGFNFTLLMGQALTADCVIDAQANDKIRCFHFQVGDTAANIGAWTEGRYLTYDESAGSGSNGHVGDRIEVICDGTYYHVLAFSQANGMWAAAD